MTSWQHGIKACEWVQVNAHLEKCQAANYVRSIMKSADRGDDRYSLQFQGH